jgi:hypothetical protein
VTRPSDVELFAMTDAEFWAWFRTEFPRDAQPDPDPLTVPEPYAGWTLDAEPRRFPVFGWIVLALLALVLGVAAVAVWGSR